MKVVSQVKVKVTGAKKVEIPIPAMQNFDQKLSSDRQTDRQTDRRTYTTEIIYHAVHAASRVNHETVTFL